VQLPQDTVATLSRPPVHLDGDALPPPRQHERTTGGRGRLAVLAVVALLFAAGAARRAHPVHTSESHDDRGLRMLVETVQHAQAITFARSAATLESARMAVTLVEAHGTREELASAYEQLARLQTVAGDAHGALATFRQSLILAQQRVELAPEDAAARERLLLAGEAEARALRRLERPAP
jgi:hypothetical protein